MSNELKFLLSWKPIPHFWIISVRRASLLPWKYLLVEEKEFFCSWKVSKFLHAASFANARKVTVNEFQVKNYGAVWGPLKLSRTSKTDLLTFLTNKKLLAGTIYFRFLIYLKAIYEQKNERNWFFNSCHKIKILVDK